MHQNRGSDLGADRDRNQNRDQNRDRDQDRDQDGKKDTLRAFVAIRLPGELLTRLKSLQADLVREFGFPIRWVAPEKIHLTLKFLGEIEPDQVEEVREAMTGAARKSAPLFLRARGLGVFPRIANAKVFWVGLEGQTHELIELQKRLDEELARVGFQKETRPFRAHLTLGRTKGKIDPKALGEAITTFGGFETEPFCADRFHLFRSQLRPAGAVYTRLIDLDFKDKP